MKSNKRCNPEILTRKIEKQKKISSDGNVSFSGSEFSYWADILSCIMQPNASIPEIEKARLTRGAIFEAGRKGVITPDSIHIEVSKALSKFLSAKPKEYVLVSQISIAGSVTIPRITYAGATIRFSHAIPKKFEEQRADLMKTAKRSVSGTMPTGYAWVVVNLGARSAMEAGENALNALNVVRGIFNFYINRSVHFRMSSGHVSPVNRITLGPIHTLHKACGELATDSWWYEQDYAGSIAALSDVGTINELYPFFRRVVKMSTKSAYKDEMLQSIGRYSSALDTRNLSYSLLRLWGELEFLTSSRHNNYDATIKRCAFLFVDKEYVTTELNAIRDFRNSYVHEGKESHYKETLLYRLKHYVEVLIEFNIAGSGFYSSLSEFGEYLDTTHNVEELKGKIIRLKRALKFLSH